MIPGSRVWSLWWGMGNSTQHATPLQMDLDVPGPFGPQQPCTALTCTRPARVLGDQRHKAQHVEGVSFTQAASRGGGGGVLQLRVLCLHRDLLRLPCQASDSTGHVIGPDRGGVEKRKLETCPTELGLWFCKTKQNHFLLKSFYSQKKQSGKTLPSFKNPDQNSDCACHWRRQLFSDLFSEQCST